MKNTVYISNKQKVERLSDAYKSTVKKTVNAALKHEGIAFPCELSVTFTDNEGIRVLNRDYRQKDTATDVLSFPLFEKEDLASIPVTEKAVAIGDIVISLERAREQACSFGHAIEREIGFLTVHSILHLVGYDHETSPEDETYMNDAAEEVLASLGLTRELPYVPLDAAAEPAEETAEEEPSAEPDEPEGQAEVAEVAEGAVAAETVDPDKMRTGFITILGRPNVGKSTLLNAVVGEKVAIVSKKPQTTRNKITGVLTQGTDQFVFVDTPGIHKPKNKLGEYMMKEVADSVVGTDAVVFVVEPTDKPTKTEEEIAERIRGMKVPAILVINKVDSVKKSKILLTIDRFSKLCEFASVVPISALENDGVDIVLDELRPFLKQERWYFPADILTDQPVRQIAAEIIREKLLRTLDEEIPHGIAVVIEDFNETDRLISIRAELYCEKEAHKKIIIGKNGEALKKVATFAREDMEAFFDKKVFLDVWVKVKENWRDSLMTLNRLGFRED